MSDKLVGSWTLDRTENFEEFIKEYGLNIVLRKIAASIKPTVIIAKEGDKWFIKTRSTFKNEDDEFIIGVEFDKESQDGRKVKILAKIQDDKLIGEQRDRKSGELQVIAVKYVTDNDEMIEELTCKNVKCKRIFRRNK